MALAPDSHIRKILRLDRAFTADLPRQSLIHQLTNLFASASTQAFLEDLLSRYAWISAFSHSPELTTLIRTNTAPTTFQATRLQALFSGLDAPITDIQSEIDLLQNATAALETQMFQLKSIRRDYQTALSPICHLPTEILLEIFRWTQKELPEPGSTDNSAHICGFNVFSIAEGPWYLGQRSGRDWRTEVDVPHRSVGEDDEQTVPVLKNMVALLERALERSQERRLDFFFMHEGFDEASAERSDEQLLEHEAMNQCFDLLLTHSKRLRSIELIIPPPLLSRLSLVHGRVDQIEDIYLECISVLNTPPGTIDAFEIAPNLQYFHLEDMHPEVNVLFPTDNLVSFVDGRRLPDHDTAPRYLDIIASAHNLLDFSYHHHSLIPESPGPYSAPVPNASLRVLSASLGTFLSGLVIPNLTNMTLTSGCDDDGNQSWPQTPIYCPRDSLSHLHSLLVVSQCSLTELCFVDATMDDNLLPILQLCPRLVILDFAWNLWGTSLSSQYVVHTGGRRVPIYVASVFEGFKVPLQGSALEIDHFSCQGRLRGYGFYKTHSSGWHTNA
ncbi:hypothetical protein EV421DRAFT_1745394 [Armillaria borealis]|uniref:F-box domain-containing protein n=1 Tax=Armillaria borealis TaxID=47425 RepID=A0AA39ISF1_9AGAR|nr:hypothetical protein EV421DRAFT_1745394 [Armillaria borealis]